MPRIHQPKTGKKNASTQTSETESSLEIAELQEQLKLLKIEISVLRKHTVAESSDSLRLTRSKVALDGTLTPKHDNLKIQSNKLDSIQNVSKSVTKTGIRGCSCKGNCSSKICGCTKKGYKCGESCRCNNVVCQNQEQKDTQTNIQQENNEHREGAIRAVKEIINDGSKGLFSPDVTVDNLKFNLKIDSVESLKFGSPKKLIFDSDDDKENENAGEEIIDKRSKRGKAKSKKNTLKSDNVKLKKIKAASNEELSSTPNDERGVTKLTTKMNGLRKYSSTEIVRKIGTNDSTKEESGNYHKNIEKGMAPLRRGRQQKEFINEEKSNSHLGGDTLGSSNEDQNNSTEEEDAVKLEDTSFDPMKPMHQLMRTPTSTSGDTSNFGNVSDVPLPMPVLRVDVNEGKKQNTITVTDLQLEVNWEEYQSQLVACGKCKRKFDPKRIAKHVACCKNL